MIKRFINGRRYICLVKQKQSHWTMGKDMNGVLDGKSHMCIKTGIAPHHAQFDCTPPGPHTNDTWSWRLQNFKEVKTITNWREVLE